MEFERHSIPIHRVNQVTAGTVQRQTAYRTYYQADFICWGSDHHLKLKQFLRWLTSTPPSCLIT